MVDRCYDMVAKKSELQSNFTKPSYNDTNILLTQFDMLEIFDQPVTGIKKK